MSANMTDNLDIISQSDDIEIELMGDDLNIIQKLDDEPNDVGGLTADQLKARFDEAGNRIKSYINEKLIPAVIADAATEASRASAENARNLAEAERSEAEAARKAAELARCRWEDYSEHESYVYGNRVVYNGSSYVNVYPCKGVPPTEGAYWLLIAEKGEPGPAPVKGTDYWTQEDQEAIVAEVRKDLGDAAKGAADLHLWARYAVEYTIAETGGEVPEPKPDDIVYTGDEIAVVDGEVKIINGVYTDVESAWNYALLDGYVVTIPGYKVLEAVLAERLVEYVLGAGSEAYPKTRDEDAGDGYQYAYLGELGKWLCNGEDGAEDRLRALEQNVADLMYHAIDITAFSNDSSTVELGSTVRDVELVWEINKTPVTLLLDGEEIEPTLTSMILQGLKITGKKTWTLEAADERGAADSKTTSITFVNAAYYGAAAAPETLDSAFVLSLTKKLTDTRKRTITVDAAAGQHIWYAVPVRLGACTFKVGGFEGGFDLAATVDFTNAHGYTEPYYIYRSGQTGLGSTTVEVS